MGMLHELVGHHFQQSLLHRQRRLAARQAGAVADPEDVRIDGDRRLAERFGEDRIWLAGDAAHLTGPAGIQSMNVGLQEAHDLANLMADNLQDKATLADLERYERRDHERWRFLLGLEGGIAAGPDADDWVRLYGERLISCLPAAGSDLDALMRQLNAPAVNSY